MATKKKRPGTINLNARHTLAEIASDMNGAAQRVLAGYINRWLDNGHNLDDDDITWLAAIAAANNPPTAPTGAGE